MKNNVCLFCWTLFFFTSSLYGQYYNGFSTDNVNHTSSGGTAVNPQQSNVLDGTFNVDLDLDGLDHMAYWDFGSVLSATQWVVRFKMTTLNMTSDASNGNSTSWFCISQSTNNQAAGQQCLGFQFYQGGAAPANKIFVGQVGLGAGGGIYGTGNRADASGVMNSTWYIEMIRNNGVFSVSFFDDANFSVLNANLGTTNWNIIESGGSFNGLRYFMFHNRAFTSTKGGAVQIDDVQICDGVTTFSCPLLPIELLSFDANWKDENKNSVVLTWETEVEIDNDFFTIERSKDAINFEEVTEVDGAGNSSIRQSYSTIDEAPYNGISYYRLKQTDFDGDFSYSQIEVLNAPEGLEIINLYPNPVIDNLNFMLVSSLSDDVQVVIYNQLGQIVLNKKETILAKANPINMDVGDLSEGHYQVQVVTSSGNYHAERKFIIHSR